METSSSADLRLEKLVLITSRAHPAVKRAADVAHESVLAFPRGCAYRRVLERWLGDKDLLSVRVLELGSYHAIVACVASGAGIAIVPESVLATVQSAMVAIHSLPKVLSNVSTPLIWRTGEQTPSVAALREMTREMSSGLERRPTPPSPSIGRMV